MPVEGATGLTQGCFVADSIAQEVPRAHGG